MKIALVFGTRPEAIKLVAVARELREHSGIKVELWNTGQHQHLVDPILNAFDLEASRNLSLMTNGQGPGAFFARAVAGIASAISEDRPDLLFVQGDTSTAAAASVAAFYERIPIAHVEAGLRTYDLNSPWPEEYNRRVIAQAADWHFAPTEKAKDNLRNERIPEERIVVTGNTGIDALLWMVARLRRSSNGEIPQRWQFLDLARPIVLCTLHRRESFGGVMHGLMRALKDIAVSEDAQLILPLHPNPAVREAAGAVLGSLPSANLKIVEPLAYEDFLWLMDHCRFLISDSGGVQEEAPALGKPVIVTRERTERPEAVEAGANVLAGTEPSQIGNLARALLHDTALYQRMARPRWIYGDGMAARRISQVILNQLGATEPSPGCLSSQVA